MKKFLTFALIACFAASSVFAEIPKKVKVSEDDTTAGYLNGKLVAGTGIAFTENNNGANETLTITASGIGDVSSNTSSSVDSEVALFSGTGGKTIKRASGTGFGYLTSGVLSAVAILSSSHINWSSVNSSELQASGINWSSTTDLTTGGAIKADSVALGTDTTGNYAGSSSEGGAATTATALAANGSNCSAGSYPLGVDASGAVESCTDATTEIDSAIATHASNSSAHHAPVTVTDSSEIDFTLSTQNVTASVKAASLASSKINWSSIAALELQSSGFNWSSVPAQTVQRSQINWSNFWLDSASGINWGAIPGAAADYVLKRTSSGINWQASTGGAGTVDTANSPNANEFARFTDADTIEGRTASETKADLDLEVGTDLQAWDADLDTWAGKTAPSGTVVGTSDTQILTAKTIDGDDNTLQDIAYSQIKSTSRSGADVTLVTGTKGATDDCAKWNADGDLVSAGAACGTGGSGGDNVLVDGGSVVDPDFDSGGDIDFVNTSNVITANVKANSVALGTDTTGNYALGDAEGGAATTGDSATSFFAAGTIEAARLPDADDDASTKGIATWADADVDCTTGSCSIASTLTRDSEWDTLSEINAATTDADAIGTNSSWTGGDLAGTGLAATVTTDVLDYDNINFGNTLAGNPALDVDECYLMTTTTGGGFICEGSTANTNEQLYKFPDVDGADTTELIITATQMDTIGELETLSGGGNIILATEIDTSAELRAILGDETGTGAAVFVGGAIGAATATTASANDNDTSVATTAYVQTELNAAGGRSLTCASGSCDADVELYTDTKCIRFENPVDADDLKSLWTNHTGNQLTVTKLWCESDQTVTAMLQVDDGTPADMDSVDLSCTSTPATDTSLNGDATIAAGDRVDLDVASVSGTPTWVSICFTGTYDD